MPEDEMGSDADLLNDIMAQWTAKQIGFSTGLAANTVYAYREGRINAPLTFWARLFAKTRDARIPMALFVDAPHSFVAMDNLPDMSSDVASLRFALVQLQQFHDLQSELAEIVADGRIDGADAGRLAEYNRHYAKFVQHNAAVHAGLNKAFAQATATQERQ